MRRIRFLFVPAVLAGLVAGCAAPEPPAPPPAPPATPAPDASAPELPSRETRVVYFESGSDRLSPEAKREIAAAARSAAKGRKALFVTGHADSVGSARYNKLLSGRRADAVIAELGKHGIDRGISILVEGDSHPAVATPDGADEALNRRVEITIVR